MSSNNGALIVWCPHEIVTKQRADMWCLSSLMLETLFAYPRYRSALGGTIVCEEYAYMDVEIPPYEDMFDSWPIERCNIMRAFLNVLKLLLEHARSPRHDLKKKIDSITEPARVYLLRIFPGCTESALKVFETTTAWPPQTYDDFLLLEHMAKQAHFANND
jgi:hypothetical protein